MISPIKGLGQHFLVNAGVVTKIAAAVGRLCDDGRDVIEVGPGPGALTEALLATGRRVVALEIDPRMVQALGERFAAAIIAGRLEVRNVDALNVRASDFVDGRAWTVCGNLPYNVGTPIVFRFLEEFPRADRFCFMLQKEVVTRLVARDGGRTYGSPSVKMAWATETLGQFTVKPGSFLPPPKVDSAVFWFRRAEGAKLLADPLVRDALYDQAGAFVDDLFQRRRKMLRGTLAFLANEPLGMRRPEEISPSEFLSLFDVARKKM